MGATGALSKAFLFGLNDVEAIGLPGFLEVLDRRKNVKERKRGLVTVCNHISVLDDPLVWGVLPLRYGFDPYNHRWSLGAHDLMFSNKVMSNFFSLGQVLPTHRKLHSHYGGPFQATMNQAIKLLSAQPFPAQKSTSMFTTNGQDSFFSPAAEPERRHGWIHVFPEGFVHQHHTLAMRYFKWGVARLILEAEPLGPELVPMFVDGTQHIMPEDRKFLRFLPRPGKKITVAFGDSIDTDVSFADLRDRWKELVAKHQPQDTSGPGYLAVENQQGRAPAKTVGEFNNLPHELKYGREALALRIETTKRVRDEVSKLRRRLGYPEEPPSNELAEAWIRSGIEPKTGKPAENT